MHRLHLPTWTVASFFLSGLVIAAAFQAQRSVWGVHVGSVRDAVTSAGSASSVRREVTKVASPPTRPVRPAAVVQRPTKAPGPITSVPHRGALVLLMLAQGPGPFRIVPR